MQTQQIEFWKSDFGKEYTDRSSHSAEGWDEMYVKTWGKTKIEMNSKSIGDLPKNSKILEVGCNTGMQLNGLSTDCSC